MDPGSIPLRRALTGVERGTSIDDSNSNADRDSSCRPCSLGSLDARTRTQSAEAYATKEKRTGC
jgi:hypothetical protein